MSTSTTRTLFTLPNSETITDDVLVSENIEQTLSNKKFKDNNNNEYTIDDIPKLNTANTFTANIKVPSITLNNTDLQTTLNNCAKTNTANTFTASQTINSNLTVNTSNSDRSNCALFMSPNMITGNRTIIRIGKGYGTNNNVGLHYYYDSSNSSNIHFGLQYDGGSILIKVYIAKAVFDIPLTVNGNVTASAFVQSSDIRKKENIQELNESDENPIDNIKVYSFNLIDDIEEPKRKHYGVIAQELQEVMPELVYDDRSENHYLSVNYTELIPHLINKVKTQQKLINEQNEKINDLTNKINHVFEVLGITSEKLIN